MRILVAEDEEPARKGIVNLVRSIHPEYQIVAQARNGKLALELIRKLHPDLVLTDIRMPYMDGLELMRAIRELGLPVRFIIVSTYADFEYAKSAIDLGVSGYLHKPVTKEELREALRRVEGADSAVAAPSAPPGEDSVHPTVRKVLAVIGEEYAEKLTLEELARRMRITPEYLSYLFHRNLGIKFATYLKQVRMDKAKELLAEGGCKVYEVAARCGYPDTKYFCRIFREVNSVSPSEYMRLYADG